MLNIIYNASCWQTSYITGSIGRDFYGLIEFQAWVTYWLFSRPSPAKTLIKALTVNTAQIHWQSLSQITRQGGNGDEEVHLQTAEKPQRGGELSTTDIISHQDLLISHARHKHKQGDIHRCPAWWRTWRQRRRSDYRRGRAVSPDTCRGIGYSPGWYGEQPHLCSLSADCAQLQNVEVEFAPNWLGYENGCC